MTMTEVNERSSSSVTPDDEDDELLTPRVNMTIFYFWLFYTVTIEIGNQIKNTLCNIIWVLRHN